MVQSKSGFILRKEDKEENGTNDVQQQQQDSSSSSSSSTLPLLFIGMRQLYDPESCTYTYLVWDKETEDAILIDPVDTQVKRDLLVATELNLVYAINTHCHADHISGTSALKKKVKGLKSVISKASGAQADIIIENGDEIHFGNRYLTAIATPGHTLGCMSFVLDDHKLVFTGDALLIQGCGRTDFQNGSSETLYDSITQKLFNALPDDTIVFPGHDYHDRTHTTIGKEKHDNPRIGNNKTKEEFIDIMDHLNLPYPKKMDIAVPANLHDGAKPFFVRSLRSRVKERWGIFG